MIDYLIRGAINGQDGKLPFPITRVYDFEKLFKPEFGRVNFVQVVNAKKAHFFKLIYTINIVLQHISNFYCGIEYPAPLFQKLCAKMGLARTLNAVETERFFYMLAVLLVKFEVPITVRYALTL